MPGSNNFPRRAAFTAFCLALISPGASASAATRDLDAVLAQARAAVGTDWARTHAGIRMSGRSEYLGLDGTTDLVLMADGRFVRRVDAAIPSGLGFDGARVWLTDRAGMPRVLDHAERAWAEIRMAVVAGTWMREGSPVTVTLGSPFARTGAAPDTIALTLRHRRSGFECELRLDARTGLPAVLTRRAIVGEDGLRFEGYREFLGARFPTIITQPTLGTATVYRTSKVVPVADGGIDFGMPAEPHDSKFVAGASPEIEVRRAPTGHFLVRPRVNGKDVGWFIFDTGAGAMTLSPTTAKELGLPEIARTGIMSVVGAQEAAMRRADSLRLGSLEIDSPLFVDFDLGFVEAHMGEKIAGVIGYDVLRRAVVEVDVSQGRLALHDPKTYDGSQLPWQPLYMSEQHPVIEAAFEGHTGLFKLDLGAAGGPFGNVTIHAPAVERLKLIEGRTVTKRDLGTAKVAIGKLDWFELGGHRFEEPEATFALGGPGPFQDPTTLGNIGVSFLAPFRVIFDYGRQRVALVEREGD